VARRKKMNATVTETLEFLARVDSNGLRLYATPGSNKPYWASTPSFMYDVCVATVSDFATAAGFDTFGFYSAEMQEYIAVEGEETYSITVAMPEYVEHRP
jgi:hypothetical protein